MEKVATGTQPGGLKRARETAQDSFLNRLSRGKKGITEKRGLSTRKRENELSSSQSLREKVSS